MPVDARAVTVGTAAVSFALFSVGVSAFAAGLRASRRSARTPIRRPTVLELDVKALSAARVLELAELHPGLVFYDGMPPDIAPAGYQVIDVWVTDERGTYPDPRRFREFHELVDQGRRDDFMDTYAFAVVDGTRLTFYVLGKPASGCCAQVSCSASAYPKEGTKLYRTGLGGTPEGHRARLGAMWSCRCDGPTGECWTLVRPTVQNHPQANRG